MWKEKKPQTLANHGRFVPPYHFVISLILVVNLLWRGWHLIRHLFSDAAFSYRSVIEFLVALALIGMFFFLRDFPLTTQDRIICLEERLRLQQVLPDDLRGRIGDLEIGQLIGLRFAPDDELSDLVRAVLDEGVSDRKEIKQRIKSWRPDYHRL